MVPFGDSSAEVPRRSLSEGDVRELVDQEIANRNDTAALLDSLGRHEAASALRGEAEILSRYASR